MFNLVQVAQLVSVFTAAVVNINSSPELSKISPSSAFSIKHTLLPIAVVVLAVGKYLPFGHETSRTQFAVGLRDSGVPIAGFM